MKSIFNIDIDGIINDNITLVLNVERPKFVNKVKQMYFVGQTLCIDLKDGDVLTVNHSTESVGFFSGESLRRLLPIKTLKLLEILMDDYGVKFERKWTQIKC